MVRCYVMAGVISQFVFDFSDMENVKYVFSTKLI